MYWIIVKQMVWRPFFEEDWPKLTEEAMAPHSSILAWRIPGTGEPGGLPSMGSHRVGHDWSNLAAAADLNLMEWGWVGAQLVFSVPHRLVFFGGCQNVWNVTKTNFWLFLEELRRPQVALLPAVWETWVGKIPWRRAWQATPVFLSGESHGQRICWATVRGVAKSHTWLSSEAQAIPDLGFSMTNEHPGEAARWSVGRILKAWKQETNATVLIGQDVRTEVLRLKAQVTWH